MGSVGDLPIERDSAPERPAASFLTKVAIGALALFGAISLAGWLIDRIFGLVKLAIFIVIAVAAVALAARWATRRR
jgi:hypothetical protein